MKLTSLLRNSILSFLLVASVIFTNSGCEDTTEPKGPDPITEDLFPLIVGRQIVYSGFLRARDVDTNITATGAVFEARMLVASNNQATPVGGTSHLLLDSMRVPTGIPTPPTFWRITRYFVKRDQPTGPHSFSFLTGIGSFYRRFGIARTDTLKWILLADMKAGLDNEWIGFDSTWTSPTGLVRLQIVGKFTRETITTATGQTFNTYKVTATRKIYLGGSPTASVVSPTATLWLAPNIGIVRFIFNADHESPGFWRDFRSKNF